MIATIPAIIGMGMTKFGRYPDRSLKELGAGAIRAALDDAGLRAADIDMAFVANAMAGVITGQVSVVGQTVLREIGFSELPVYNIDNACAGSSSALGLAVHAVQSGAAETVLVAGVEKLVCEDRAKTYRALNGAADVEFVAESAIDPERESVFIKAVYPPRLNAYASSHPLDARTLASIAVKNRNHAAFNPFAQYTQPLGVEEVLGSRIIAPPITALMCAPIGDGASAVIVAAGEYANERSNAVWVRATGVGMSSGKSASTLRRISSGVYAAAGISAADVDVAEVHDSTAFNELLAYEELGFCELGGASQMVHSGDTALGGKIPVNPSGGLESRGHPVAATGLAQVIEIGLHLRGEAGERQVPGAEIGLAESAGGFAGGDTAAVAVTVLGAERT